MHARQISDERTREGQRTRSLASGVYRRVLAGIIPVRPWEGQSISPAAFKRGRDHNGNHLHVISLLLSATYEKFIGN
jgi:hypothetical protein